MSPVKHCVRRRPQNAQHDSPAASLQFPWERAYVAFCLPGRLWLCSHLSPERTDYSAVVEHNVKQSQRRRGGSELGSCLAAATLKAQWTITGERGCTYRDTGNILWDLWSSISHCAMCHFTLNVFETILNEKMARRWISKPSFKHYT